MIRRLDSGQLLAVREAWRALWLSRLVVWGAGIFAFLKLGGASVAEVPPVAQTSNFGFTLLTRPAVAYDSANYLTIARDGYSYLDLTAFYPLYPALISGAGTIVRSDIFAGIGLSIASFAVALYLLHRLVQLELGDAHARTTVLVMAFFPTALFFSAVYTEGLFLALSVGAFYSARRGWWARAAVLAMLASATRNTGVLLLLPLVVMYLHGPRENPAPGPRIRPNFAWLALVPLGLAAFFVYLHFHTGDAFTSFTATKEIWGRETEPLAGLWQGAEAAARSLAQIAAPSSDSLPTDTYENTGDLSNPLVLAQVNLLDFAFLAFAIVACVGALRRLPLAYGLYAAAGIVVPLSAPAPYEPLMSMPRYLAVLFPLHIWLALQLGRGRRLEAALVAMGALLALLAAEFANYNWVA